MEVVDLRDLAAAEPVPELLEPLPGVAVDVAPAEQEAIACEEAAIETVDVAPAAFEIVDVAATQTFEADPPAAPEGDAAEARDAIDLTVEAVAPVPTVEAALAALTALEAPSPAPLPEALPEWRLLADPVGATAPTIDVEEPTESLEDLVAEFAATRPIDESVGRRPGNARARGGRAGGPGRGSVGAGLGARAVSGAAACRGDGASGRRRGSASSTHGGAGSIRGAAGACRGSADSRHGSAGTDLGPGRDGGGRRGCPCIREIQRARRDSRPAGIAGCRPGCRGTRAGGGRDRHPTSRPGVSSRNCCITMRVSKRPQRQTSNLRRSRRSRKREPAMAAAPVIAEEVGPCDCAGA